MLQDWTIVLAGLEEVSRPSPAPGPHPAAQGFPSEGVEIPRDEKGSAFPGSPSCGSLTFFLKIQSSWSLLVPKFMKHTHPLGGNGLFWAIRAKLHSEWLEEAAQDYSQKHHSSFRFG